MLQSAMKSFTTVPGYNGPRSSFDRSHGVKSTFNFDYLIPVFVDQVVPGDTFNVSLNSFARLATQKVPVMDNMFIDYFFFYVPYRLVQDNFKKLMGEKAAPADSINYILPQMVFPAGGPEVDTIFDHFGLPTDVPGSWTLKNTLPLRAYLLIWNEWFRSQDLQDPVVVPKDDGPDVPADFMLLKRGRKHDYFSSCLPWPQKGTQVMLPLGTTAVVERVANGGAPLIRIAGGAGLAGTTESLRTTAAGVFGGATSGNTYSLDPNGSLVANLSTATAATLNQLREAFAIQSLLERDARGGTRYAEMVRAHFGVDIGDATLQRPEYLGGGSTRINSHPVPNASGTGTQASLAAFATSSANGIGFTKSFVEHGCVIGLACARGEITYQQGLEKMWNMSTRYDFFWPEFNGLGEQAVLNKEIYLNGDAADENVFGYQERYAELKFKFSQIHGRFRSTYATPIDQWHLAEEFATRPALNATFMQQNTPIERSIAVTTEPHLLFDGWFNMKCARPLPVHNMPVSLGRF